MPDPRGGWELRTDGEAPFLLIVAGLPRGGKTTLCRRLAARLLAAHLRIDTIEEALADAGAEPGVLGYTIAYAVALDNLKAGLSVVADSVNSVEITRSAWRDVASTAGARIVEVEIVCSDAIEHRRSVEARLGGGRSRPTWADVTAREYEVWPRPVRSIDTAGRTEEDCLRQLLANVVESQTKKAPPDEPAGPS